MSSSRPARETPVLLICHRCRLVHDESCGLDDIGFQL
jgi:hypothetical protein